jgi:hypothetical protein
MVIFDGVLVANQPSQSIPFSAPFSAIVASSTDFGNYLTTGQTFDLSTALIGTISGIARVFPKSLLMVNNRDFHLIDVNADSYQVFIYPGIDMHLKLEVV